MNISKILSSQISEPISAMKATRANARPNRLLRTPDSDNFTSSVSKNFKSSLESKLNYICNKEGEGRFSKEIIQSFLEDIRTPEQASLASKLVPDNRLQPYDVINIIDKAEKNGYEKISKTISDGKLSKKVDELTNIFAKDWKKSIENNKYSEHYLNIYARALENGLSSEDIDVNRLKSFKNFVDVNIKSLIKPDAKKISKGEIYDINLIKAMRNFDDETLHQAIRTNKIDGFTKFISDIDSFAENISTKDMTTIHKNLSKISDSSEKFRELNGIMKTYNQFSSEELGNFISSIGNKTEFNNNLLAKLYKNIDINTNNAGLKHVEFNDDYLADLVDFSSKSSRFKTNFKILLDGAKNHAAPEQLKYDFVKEMMDKNRGLTMNFADAIVVK